MPIAVNVTHVHVVHVMQVVYASLIISTCTHLTLVCMLCIYIYMYMYTYVQFVHKVGPVVFLTYISNSNFLSFSSEW